MPCLAHAWSPESLRDATGVWAGAAACPPFYKLAYVITAQMQWVSWLLKLVKSVLLQTLRASPL